MKAPDKKPEVKLIGKGGNAFPIMMMVIKALRKAGADQEYIDQYKKEAMSGNYDHLLQVTMKYVEVG